MVFMATKYYEYEYGFKSIHELDPLMLELTLYNMDWRGARAMHFKNIVRMLWPEDAKPPIKPFVWHPWAEHMLEYACKWKYLGIIGCASSGKTNFGAIWAIVNWLSAPKESLILVTSTSLGDSRKRVWGDIKAYIQQSLLGKGMPCKIIDSRGMILTDDPATPGQLNDKQGIALIAGAPDKERESIGKLIGMKNRRVIMVADELPELSPALLDAAFSNLSTQIDGTFQMIGIGNFKSVYDPLGEFVKPKMGYKNINPSMQEWETEKGWCIRFDGLQSPNILNGKNEWPIYGSKHLEEHRRTCKENSSQFWRMVRSFPCPEGMDDVIYSDADFIAGDAHNRVKWAFPPVRVAGLDPSFTNGGDRSMAVIGSCGNDVDGNHVVQVDRVVHLTDDVTRTGTTRNFQIAEAFRNLCVAEHVQPKHAGMDATAGGAVFYDVLVELWSNDVLPVKFGGAASEYPVNTADPRPSSEHYVNRVSELWYFGVELLKGGQLKGITDDMAMEMKSRKYETTKGASVKIKVESKTDMKDRVGYSPDLGDALMIVICVCRERLGLLAGALRHHSRRNTWAAKKEADASVEIYETSDYSAQDPEELYEHAGYSEPW